MSHERALGEGTAFDAEATRVLGPEDSVASAAAAFIGVPAVGQTDFGEASSVAPAHASAAVAARAVRARPIRAVQRLVVISLVAACTGVVFAGLVFHGLSRFRSRPAMSERPRSPRSPNVAEVATGAPSGKVDRERAALDVVLAAPRPAPAVEDRPPTERQAALLLLSGDCPGARSEYERLVEAGADGAMRTAARLVARDCQRLVQEGARARVLAEGGGSGARR